MREREEERGGGSAVEWEAWRVGGWVGMRENEEEGVEGGGGRRGAKKRVSKK